MQTYTFPGQTAEGIEDPETFFMLCARVGQLSSWLRQIMTRLGSREDFLGQFNCEVVTRIMAKVLPVQYGTVVIDGYLVLLIALIPVSAAV